MKKSIVIVSVITIVLILILSGVCLILFLMQQKPTTPSGEDPTWVKNLIVQFQNEPVANPPRSIWRYEYKGQVVYYISSDCCDQFNKLYDSSGNVICAPDGGLTGMGDGQCVDFSSEGKNRKLIWQDTRER